MVKKIVRGAGEELELVSLAYHRNGISGEPFHVVIFKRDGRPMVGVQFLQSQMCTAVFDIEKLSEGNIGFAAGNSWRGDAYSDVIYEWVRADKKDAETKTDAIEAASGALYSALKDELAWLQSMPYTQEYSRRAEKIQSVLSAVGENTK